MADPEFESIYTNSLREKIDWQHSSGLYRELGAAKAKVALYEKAANGKYHEGTKFPEGDLKFKKIRTEKELNDSLMLYAENIGFDVKNYHGGEHELIEHLESAYGISHDMLLNAAYKGVLDYQTLTGQMEQALEETTKQKLKQTSKVAFESQHNINELLKDERVAKHVGNLSPEQISTDDAARIAVNINNDSAIKQTFASIQSNYENIKKKEKKS